jgi:hypothetical protein
MDATRAEHRDRERRSALARKACMPEQVTRYLRACASPARSVRRGGHARCRWHRASVAISIVGCSGHGRHHTHADHAILHRTGRR